MTEKALDAEVAFDATKGTKTYVKFTATGDSALDAEPEYYTVSGDNYVKVATPNVDDIATYFEKAVVTAYAADIYVESSTAGTYEPATLTGEVAFDALKATLYVEDGKYAEVDLKDVDMKIGTIKLDAEELKVYDLRDGDVKEITLTSEENPGFSAVVYRETGAKEAGNVIFIID